MENKKTRISIEILYNLESQFRSFLEDLGLICNREFTFKIFFKYAYGIILNYVLRCQTLMISY